MSSKVQRQVDALRVSLRKAADISRQIRIDGRLGVGGEAGGNVNAELRKLRREVTRDPSIQLRRQGI